MTGTPDLIFGYKENVIFGYKEKQVRDAADSPDLTHALKNAPRIAEVYRIGGRRFSNCSVPEAIKACDQNCIWWIGANGKFASQYPKWKQSYIIESISQEIFDANHDRWACR